MEEINFKIPALPPSMNNVYEINHRTRQVYLHKNAREFKMIAKLYTPSLVHKIEDNTKLEIKVKYYGNWHNKDGSIKRKDGQNLDKVLYDSIFEKMGIDDKVAFKGSWEKVQSEEEYTLVSISLYN